MKITLTGASGFLGRHVVAGLIASGHAPHIVLRPGTEVPPGMEDLPLSRINLHDPSANAYAACGSPDLLVHLAWDGLPNYLSLHHFESELPAQYRFLRRMIDGGLPKLIVTGTCFEYGMKSGCLCESDSAQPANPYGFAKRTLLSMLEMLRAEKPFDLTWARLFYLYGEGQASSSLFSQLCAAVEAGRANFPMSGGEQLRDFLPVGDFRRDFIRLALAPGSHGVVNLCSGAPVSVRTLVERWLAERGWNIRLELGHYPYPDYEPMAFWGSRQKLDAILQSA